MRLNTLIVPTLLNVLIAALLAVTSVMTPAAVAVLMM